MRTKTCERRISVGGSELVPRQITPSALMQVFLGHGFGDDQGDVKVADDHSDRKEILHDFNGIVAIGLTRSSSVVTA